MDRLRIINTGHTFKKLQVVELDVTVAQGTSNNYQFTPQTYLSGAEPKKITSIETFTSSELTTSPQGVALITPAQLKTSYLTLYYRDNKTVNSDGLWIRQIPLVSFHRAISGTDPYVRDLFLLDKPIIVWEKSYIETYPALANSAPVAYIFSVGYEDIRLQGGGW